MKQRLNLSFSEKLNYFIILVFCFGTPFLMLYKFGFENKERCIIVTFCALFSLGIYGILKVYENSKSVFVNCNLERDEAELIIKKLGEEKYFKILPNVNSNVIRLHYKKYALGLDYDIHFFIHKNKIEFNAFCNQPGIIDFGTRKRIIKEVKDKIKSNCSSL